MVVFYHALAGKIGAMLMLFDVKRQAKDSQSHVWGFLNEISGNEFWTYGNDQINQTARFSFQTGAPQNPEMFSTFGKTKISAATDVVTARRIPPCLITV